MRQAQLTDSSKILLNALFGDPEIRRQEQLLESELSLNKARARQAEASIGAANSSAALDKQKFQAFEGLTPELFNVNRPIEQPLPEGVQGPPGFRAPDDLEKQQRFSEISSGLARIGKVDGGNLGDLLQSQEFTLLPQDVRRSKAAATPSDQVFGGALLQTQTPDQITALAQRRFEPQPKNPISVFDKQTGEPRFANPNEVIADPNRFAAPPSGATTLGDTGLDSKDAGKIINRSRNVLATTGRLRELINDTNVGLAGDVQAFTAGLQAQIPAITQVIGVNAPDINARFGLTADPEDPPETDLIDVSVGQVEFLTVSLAYALAGLQDPGGRVSDADFKAQLRALQAGPLTNPQLFIGVLDEVDRLAQQRIVNAGGDIGQAPQPLTLEQNNQSAAPARRNTTPSGITYEVIE